MVRRQFTALLAGVPAALAAAETPPRTAMGVGTASYFRRSSRDRRAGAEPRFTDTIPFIEYCHGLGAGGVQAGLSSTERRYTQQVRKLCERYGMYYEASGRLPRDETELERFVDLVKAARDAGATVIRTVLFSGRRYENHTSMETFRAAERQAWKMVTLAEPTLRKFGMKAAIENHKNYRIPELLNVMDRIQSEYIGICVDFGNNYALLEDPVELAEAFAPYAYSSHIKDHRLQEYEDGFLLFDAALGEGIIDLPRVVRILQTAQPNIRFNLETMTRDALEIPYLREDYWATFERDSLPGRDLAMTLATVKRTQTSEPLPAISDLSAEEQLQLEDENVRKGLAYGRERLGL